MYNQGVNAKVDVLGVRVDAVRLSELLERLARTVRTGERLRVMNANIRAINLAWEQPAFREILNSAEVCFCDGAGVRWGARLLGQRLPERFTPADWTWDLARLAAQQGFSLFLLGSAQGVAERAAQQLVECYPELKIAGTHHGYFDRASNSPANRAVLAQIEAARPDILLIGFGMPLQEQWLAENWPRLPVKAALTCGALFEYLSGDLQRGPRWMTENSLEWLARVILQPRRYFQRYARDLPLFFLRLLSRRLFGKLPPG